MNSQTQYSYAYTGDGHVTLQRRKDISSGIRWSRLSLRMLCIVCSAANIGFAAYYNSQWTLGPLIMMGPPAIVSILWSCIDVINLTLVWRRQGVHPIACIIVDSILTIGIGAMSGVIGFNISRLSDSGYYLAFFEGQQSEEYLRIILGFGVMMALFHLTISIVSCVQHKRKGAGSAYRSAAFVPHNEAYAMGEAPPAYTPQGAAELSDEVSAAPVTAVAQTPDKKQAFSKNM